MDARPHGSAGPRTATKRMFTLAMRASSRRLAAQPGCSQANAPEARRWLDWPPPTPSIRSAAAMATATRPTAAPAPLVRLDAAVAVTRPPVVVGVAVPPAVLGNSVAA